MSLDPVSLVCIGGATVDRKYRTRDLVRLRTSNPVTSERSFGGVARNVAENTARLGVASSLFSVLGQDENGSAIRTALIEAGVNTQHLTVSNGHATAEYVAVLEPNGELALGLADMAIFETLTPSWLQQCWRGISSSWIFADCNLPSETLQELVRLAGRHSSILAVDAVSVPKVSRLPLDLSGIGLLFLNLDEAEALLGKSDSSPEQIALALLERGAARVVLTMAEAGLIAVDCSGSSKVDAIPAQVVDTTGAGDALIAGTLVAMVTGRSLAEAVQMGTVAAALTLECPYSVRPDLSFALLESVVRRDADQRPEVRTL